MTGLAGLSLTAAVRRSLGEGGRRTLRTRQDQPPNHSLDRVVQPGDVAGRRVTGGWNDRGHSLRAASAAQESRVCRRRSLDAGARHRRGGGDVRAHPGRAPVATSVREPGAVGAPLTVANRWPALHTGGQHRPVDRLALGSGHRGAGALSLDVQLPRAARRKRVARRHGRNPELLQCGGTDAGAGPGVRRVGGQPAEGSANRNHPRLRAVATQVQRRSQHRRKHGATQPLPCPVSSGRCDARRCPLPAGSGKRQRAELRRQCACRLLVVDGARRDAAARAGLECGEPSEGGNLHSASTDGTRRARRQSGASQS